MKPKKLFFVLLLIVSLPFSLGITLSKKALEKTQKEETIYTNNEPQTKETYCLGKVLKIISDYKEVLPGGNKQRSQQLLLKILSGEDKGKKRGTLNVIPDNPAFAIVGEVGKTYLVIKTENLENGNEDYFIADYYREHFIWYLSGLFLFILIVIGKGKGLRGIVSLFATIGLIAFLLLPWLEKGFNPLLAAVLVSLLATAITMFFVAGFSLKFVSATLGTLIGVTFSGVIATTVINTAHFTGLTSNEAMILWGNRIFELNFRGLLAAGMIVSCLGAVEDVAISIASAVHEIKTANPNYTIHELFSSGMNVGRDIMCSMTNTLVLAYTGMALPMLLLISHERNPLKFINLESVISEVTAAIAGSIGLIICVPATAFIMSYLVSKKNAGRA